MIGPERVDERHVTGHHLFQRHVKLLHLLDRVVLGVRVLIVVEVRAQFLVFLSFRQTKQKKIDRKSTYLEILQLSHQTLELILDVLLELFRLLCTAARHRCRLCFLAADVAQNESSALSAETLAADSEPLGIPRRCRDGGPRPERLRWRARPRGACSAGAGRQFDANVHFITLDGQPTAGPPARSPPERR